MQKSLWLHVVALSKVYVIFWSYLEQCSFCFVKHPVCYHSYQLYALNQLLLGSSSRTWCSCPGSANERCWTCVIQEGFAKMDSKIDLWISMLQCWFKPYKLLSKRAVVALFSLLFWSFHLGKRFFSWLSVELDKFIWFIGFFYEWGWGFISLHWNFKILLEPGVSNIAKQISVKNAWFSWNSGGKWQQQLKFNVGFLLSFGKN